MGCFLNLRFWSIAKPPPKRITYCERIWAVGFTRWIGNESLPIVQSRLNCKSFLRMVFPPWPCKSKVFPF